MKQPNKAVYHSGYYRLSKLLKPLSFGTLALLVIFAAVVFIFFGQEMTLSHFRYFLNNFDFSENASQTAGDVFYYDADADASFGFVSGGFVTLTDSRVFVTDRASSTTLSAHHGYRAPLGAYSDRYMVIYDRSGSSATVYDAFSSLGSFTYEGTVQSAVASDSGVFAIAVQDVDRYYTKIYVYDGELSLVRTVSKYKYLVDMTLDDDGKTLYTVSRYVEDGKILYEVQTVSLAEGRATATVTLSSPIYRMTLDGDLLLLLGEDGLFACRGEETVLQKAFDGNVYQSGALDGGFYFVTGGADSRKEQFGFYAAGEELSIELSSRLTACESDGDYLYLLTEDTLLCVDRKTKAAVDLGALRPRNEILTLTRDKSAVYLVGADRADRLVGAELVENFGK